MVNSNSSEKNPRETIGTKSSGGASTLRDASGSFTQKSREISDDAGNVLNDAVSTASDYYDRASHWITENVGGRNAGFLAVVAVAGLVGYMIGRGNIGGFGVSDSDSY